MTALVNDKAIKRMTDVVMPDLKRQITAFMHQTKLTRTWIDIYDETNDFHVIRFFIRNAIHAVDRTIIRDCFDLGTIYIDERVQRNGFFTRILDWCEIKVAAEGRGALYIECIQDEWLVEWLKKRGYIHADVTNTEKWSPPSYAILLSEIENKIARGAYGL